MILQRKKIPAHIAKIAVNNPDKTGYSCPKCGYATGVIDSRPQETTNGRYTVRRRRTCISCGYRVTTMEIERGSDDESVYERQKNEKLDLVVSVVEHLCHHYALDRAALVLRLMGDMKK